MRVQVSTSQMYLKNKQKKPLTNQIDFKLNKKSITQKRKQGCSKVNGFRLQLMQSINCSVTVNDIMLI